MGTGEAQMKKIRAETVWLRLCFICENLWPEK
jgi:hypothetical protein